MKIVKGFIITVLVLAVLLVVNIICNKNGIELNSVGTGTISAVAAMLIYGGLTKKDKTENEEK